MTYGKLSFICAVLGILILSGLTCACARESDIIDALYEEGWAPLKERYLAEETEIAQTAPLDSVDLELYLHRQKYAAGWWAAISLQFAGDKRAAICAALPIWRSLGAKVDDKRFCVLPACPDPNRLPLPVQFFEFPDED